MTVRSTTKPWLRSSRRHWADRISWIVRGLPAGLYGRGLGSGKEPVLRFLQFVTLGADSRFVSVLRVPDCRFIPTDATGFVQTRLLGIQVGDRDLQRLSKVLQLDISYLTFSTFDITDGFGREGVGDRL